MVKVVKSQPFDHSTKRAGGAVDTTDHVVPSGQFNVVFCMKVRNEELTYIQCRRMI